MRKKLIRIGLVLLSIIIICAIAATVLFRNEIRSLSSIRQIDDYGMFQMTYFGEYGFEDFLLIGAESDRDIEIFVMERLL